MLIITSALKNLRGIKLVMRTMPSAERSQKTSKRRAQETYAAAYDEIRL